MRTTPIKYRILATFLMACVLLLVVNKAIYTHSHILADGTIITHAHPYDKKGDNAPFKSHHHSVAEISVLKIFSYTSVLFFAFTLLHLSKKGIELSLFSEKAYHFVCRRKCNGRAPPIFL